MSSTPLDLEAIRAMVRTSKDGTQATDPRAARHVPDLLDEIDRLRTQIEADSDYEALARDERDHRESQLIEQRDHLQVQVDAVRALADRAEQNARRWEHPIPAPEWVGALRQALGDATAINDARASDEYRHCGATIDRPDDTTYTCNRRVAHEGGCGPLRDN